MGLSILRHLSHQTLSCSSLLSSLGVAVIDNLVYAVGGSNRDDGTRSNLNSMERYNPEKDEWEDMPPMHRSRGAASVTALNNCLYAVGGYDSGTYIRVCTQFPCTVRNKTTRMNHSLLPPQVSGCVKWNVLTLKPASGVSLLPCTTVVLV